jgi:multiple sugar transport system ATP-binding protein
MYGDFPIDMARHQVAALTSPRVIVGTRPEGFRLLDTHEQGYHATIQVVEELGTDTFLYLTSDDAESRNITMRRDPSEHHAVGDRIAVRTSRAAMHLFDAATGARLPEYGEAG